MRGGMRAPPLAVLVLLPLALSVVAATHTPLGDCATSTLGTTWLNQGDGDPRNDFYVEDRGLVTGTGAWVYEETNGAWNDVDVRHALQRGGASFVVPDDKDDCIDDPLVAADALVF